MGRKSTSHHPVEAETDERSLEGCTTNGARSGARGRQRMCWSMMFELFSVAAFCHQFGQCSQKICIVLFCMGHILCAKEFSFGNLEFKS